MENNCPNCNQVIAENFCSNCGQKKYKRIDRKYIWEEVQYTILHTNKGFLYSLKNLIKNPGKTAREFIDGNRVKHYKPILLAFVLSSISAFISFKILGLYDTLKNYSASSELSLNSNFMNDYMSFVSSYNSIVMLLAIPIFAFITRLALKKWGHNYYEHIVMNAYILSFYTITSIIIAYPIMYFLRSDPGAVMLVSGISTASILLILVWFYSGFYPERSLKSIIWKVLAILGLLILSYIAVIILAIIIVIIVMTIKGPEALEYIRPK